MVEAVGPVSFSNVSARQAPQAVVAAATPAASPSSDALLTASRIRIDNLQNVAILEYRSVTTGEVVRQYPSEAQIQAFRQAEKLQQEARQQRISHPAPAPQEQHVSSPAPAEHSVAPAAPAPAPTTAAAPATTTVAAPSPAPSAGAAPASHSVIV